MRALRRIAAERPAVEAVALVDADCIAAPNLLTVFDGRIRAGAAAVQAVYEVSNPAASAVSGLRYASLALVNLVRPLGKAALGLSPGLFGTGMAFSSSLLSRVPDASAANARPGAYLVASRLISGMRFSPTRSQIMKRRDQNSNGPAGLDRRCWRAVAARPRLAAPAGGAYGSWFLVMRL